MNFEELGPILRTEREKKGLSIEDVALHLKISGRVIRALEEGDDEGLPHSVYVRGFVRAYAIFLGFNDEELSAALDAVDLEESSSSPQSVYTPIDESPLSRKKIVAFIVALGIVAGGAYAYVEYANLFSDDIIPATAVTSTAKPAPPLLEPVAPQASIVPASPVAPANPVAPAPNTTAKATATRATDSPVPTAPATPARPVPPITNQQTTNPQASAPVGTPAGQTGQVIQAGQSARTGQQDTHKVIITALAECWIHSNADNTDTRQFSLRKGDTFALTFSKKLTVKLGNAGGVRIRYDGEDLPVPGADGQTRTMVFPPAP